MKNSVRIIVIIAATCLLLVIGVFVLLAIQLSNALNWSVHNEPGPSDLERLSTVALMPDLYGSIEVYADRGWRDTEYMVETFSYDSLEKLYENLPDGCSYAISYSVDNNFYDPESVQDVYGNEVTAYVLDSDNLPLIDEDTPGLKYNVLGYFRNYYLFEYPDGTYRFAAILQNT